MVFLLPQSYEARLYQQRGHDKNHLSGWEKASEAEKVDQRLWTLPTNGLLACSYFLRVISLGQEQREEIISWFASMQQSAWVQNSSRMDGEKPGAPWVSKVTLLPMRLWRHGYMARSQDSPKAPGELLTKFLMSITPGQVFGLTLATTFSLLTLRICFDFGREGLNVKGKCLQNREC